MLHTRCAFTLIETLVVLAIIGILSSLVLAGVQYARETSRRTSCQNRLYQMAIATEHFESTNAKLPMSLSPSRQGMGPFAQLAAFLEIKVGEKSNGTADFGDYYHKVPEVFRCPSGGDDLGYRWNAGTDWRFTHRLNLNEHLNGVVQFMTPIRFANLTDGLSNTALLSERLAGNGDETIQRAVVVSNISLPIEDVDKACELSRKNGGFATALTREWHSPSVKDWAYHHTHTPNSDRWDCLAYSFINPWWHSYNLAARSEHQGLVNVAYADSSVHTVSKTIDLQVWRALGTIDGGE